MQEVAKVKHFSRRPELVSRLLNGQEAAEKLGVSVAGFYLHVPGWVADGSLHPVQVGGKGRVYYPEWELDDLVKATYADGYPGRDDLATGMVAAA